MERIDYPKMTVEGRVALVTGAARGLGKWILLGLAQAGADVVGVEPYYRVAKIIEICEGIKEMEKIIISRTLL